MEIILVLIPVSLAIVGVAIAAFFWAVDNGQYEDVEQRGSDALFADDESQPPNSGDVQTPTVA